jgi:hypothetical protein
LLCQCSSCSNRHWWPVHSRNGRHCFVGTSRLLLRWWRCVFLGSTRALSRLSILFMNNVCLRCASSIAPVPQQALSCTVPLFWCRLGALACLLCGRLGIDRDGSFHCSMVWRAMYSTDSVWHCCALGANPIHPRSRYIFISMLI